MSLLSDVRFAVRSMFRRPGFSLLSVSVLAIGIGAVTVMFSTLNGVLLRPLPFDEPDELVWCWSISPLRTNNSVSAVDYFDYRERNESFSSLAALLVFTPGRIVTGQGEPESIPSTIVSANFFETLGVDPLYGRHFTPEEEIEGGPQVVMLGFSYWQRRFGGDPNVPGRVMTINGDAYEIVGVLPQGFAYPEDAELWFPMRRGGSWETSRGNRNFRVIGRLKDAVKMEAAQAQMELIAKQIEEENPDDNKGWSVRLESLHERLVGNLRVAMWILMGAVTLLLLTACANLSSLFLAKVTTRSNELALRFSLGASRGLVVRQLLTESLLITLVGASVGVGLAYLGSHLVRTLGPGDIRRLDEVDVDAAVLIFAAVVSMATGILFGIVPALKSTRVDLVQSLKEGAQSTETGRSLRMRTGLVGVQVALSLMLLIGSGLLMKSLYRLQHVNPGFNPEGVLTLRLQLPAGRYDEPFEQEQFFSNALERIAALPGVVDVSAVDGLPLRGGPYNYVHPAERPPRDPSERIPGTRRIAMDGYFRAFQIPLLAGRTFEPTDRLDSRPVVVISKTLAERGFPGENPVGKILVLPWGDGIYMEIIGVVDDLKDDGLASEYRPVFYLPFRQYPGSVLTLAVRTDGERDPTALVPALRDVVWDLDKDVPISNVSTLETRVSESTSAQKFQTFLLGTFAAIALVLTAIGLYGVLAYFVTQRRRDLGIRIALGASGSAVMAEVLRKGLLMAFVGIGLGLAGGVAATRLLGSILFETAPADPVIYVLVSAFLMLVALTACAIPAIHAVRTDPVRALKSE